MHFDTQFKEVQEIIQNERCDKTAYQAALSLLEEIESSDHDKDEFMVAMLAFWAIQASGNYEDYHVTKRLHERYDARIRAVFYNDVDPIEFHRFTRNYPQKAKTLPVHTIRNVDAYRSCAFNGMKAYFYYDDYDKAVEAGAWHLFTLIVIPREGHPKKPSFPLNGATVDRLQRMGQVLRSLEEQRKAILTRTAEILRATDRTLEAEYIESYRSPQMQRILEAGVLAEIDTSDRPMPSMEELKNDPAAVEVGDGIYFKIENQPAAEPATIDPPQKVLTNQAFSTSATFDEPMSTRTKVLIGSVLLLGVAAIVSLI